MRKRISFLFTLLLAGICLAGEPIRQKCTVCHYDTKGDFTKITTNPVAGTRFAFPLKNRCILIDLWRPVAADRIVIPLTKLAPKSPENSSECPQMKVYAGMEKNALTPAEGVKVTIEPGEAKGLATEKVTLTGLPNARYLLLYAPRTKNSYVFGLQNATKEVEVWADAPLAEDPALLAIPELDKQDPHWADSALALKGAGWIDMPGNDSAGTLPYSGKGGTSRIGWPVKFRCAEFELKEAAEVERIVLTLEKMQMQYPEMTTGLENATVYVSQDGTTFQAVKPQVKHETFRIGSKIHVRVTLTGKFDGKYFRIFAPPKKGYYVFGTTGLIKAAKFFSAAKISATDFRLPFRVADELPFLFG